MDRGGYHSWIRIDSAGRPAAEAGASMALAMGAVPRAAVLARDIEPSPAFAKLEGHAICCPSGSGSATPHPSHNGKKVKRRPGLRRRIERFDMRGRESLRGNVL